MRTSVVLIVVVAAGLPTAACQKGKTEEQQKVVVPPPKAKQPVQEPVRAPVLPLPEAMDPAKVTLKSHAVKDLGLEYASIEGIEVREGTLGNASFSMQQE